jgi:mono/diheme cytochrome c family protein
MLKPLLFASAVVLFGVTAWSATGSAAQDESKKNPAKTTEKSEARAKAIYAQDCAICHGETGDGKTDLAKDMQLKLDDWTDPKALADKQDGDLFKVIRNGKDKMPPEAEGRAKDDEVRNLILYIRGMSKQQPVAAPSATN